MEASHKEVQGRTANEVQEEGPHAIPWAANLIFDQELHAAGLVCFPHFPHRLERLDRVAGDEVLQLRDNLKDSSVDLDSIRSVSTNSRIRGHQ